MTFELTLRVVGWQTPTRFFIPCPGGTPGLYCANPKFGWIFFPRHLARAPEPIVLSKTKPAETYRIFVFGESAALGDPEPAYSFSRILRELLQEQCPGLKFEVINVSMTAINSHVILPIARDALPFQGDLWILYMGNNEVIGPFGPGSVFGLRSLPISVVRASLALRRTALGQVLNAVWERLSPRSVQQWEGMKMMLRDHVRASDPALQNVYAQFRRNLDDILALARRGKVKTVLCSVSANLKDCPPFSSLTAANLSPERKAALATLLEQGATLEQRGDPARALALYEEADAIAPAHAELAFRRARCQLALGKTAPAIELYSRARDLDGFRFRVDSPLNRIIRQVAADHEDTVQFADPESWIARASPNGVPGSDCFWDHVHFTFQGNYRVALGMADCVMRQLPDGLRRSVRGQVLTEAQCRERLAFTAFDERAVLQTMLRRLEDPPFTAQLDHEAQVNGYLARWTAINRTLNAAGLASAADVYVQALKRRNDDWVLHHRLASIREAQGNFAQAEQQWREVIALVPGSVDALFKLGDVVAVQSRNAEASEFYRQVLRLRPDSVEAMNGLGLLFLERGDSKEATRLFEKSLRLKPDFAPAEVNLGLIATARGAATEAEAHYRRAIASDPLSAAARINLGNLLAKQQRHQEAIDLYQSAIPLKPGEATLHLELGNALGALGRNAEAAGHFRTAIELNPRLGEAHFNLGVLLAKQGDMAGATACFTESVKLSPADAQAHLSLGVALAQQNRLSQAVAEFGTVLQLDPGNAAAQQYLAKARARLTSQH